MKAVVQRVSEASVRVESGEVRHIGPGLMILFCAVDGDTEDLIPKLARKTAGLRIFRDENGKMNLSALELGYSALVVSQFTLAADTKKGMRPAFIRAAEPGFAKKAYERYCEELAAAGISEIKTGEFGDEMEVRIVNDGPVTIILDTEEWAR